MTDGPWLVTGASGFLGRHLLNEIEACPTHRRTVALIRGDPAWDAMDWTRSLRGVETISYRTETALVSRPRLENLADFSPRRHGAPCPPGCG